MSFLAQSAAAPSPVSPRRRRQRYPQRLSTDTTASISSLPAYSAPLRPTPSNWPTEVTPTDQPPDYPQSAEEADTEDIDSKQSISRLRVARPQQQHTRRIRQHRRGVSSLSISSSPSVDDLLKRSVVALELSTNALLQSISTTSTLSAITSDEHPSHHKMLDKQPSPSTDSFLNQGNQPHRQPWMDDFNDILKRVDGLLIPPGNNDDDTHAVSRSLPTGTSVIPRRGKIERLYSTLTTSSELDLTQPYSSRAPRALTQYVSIESNFGNTVDATANDESIFLPSTLGLRAASQIRQFCQSPPRPSSRPHPIHKSRSIDSSSSTFVSRPSFPARQSSESPSRRQNGRRYSAGSADTSTTITSGFKGVPLSTTTTRSSSSRTSTITSFSEIPPPVPFPPPVRAMTPPTEESTPISSSEDDKPLRALQSLRKILDDSPLSKDRYSAPSPPPPSKLKLMPRTPAVVPSSGTSMATASVYRLFTRNSHHASSSTSRPKSSLKKSPVVGTQSGIPSPVDSRQSSRPSTPRQVTFAELPAEFPGRPRSTKMKNKKKAKGKSDEKEESGWLSWFTPSFGIGGSSGSAVGGTAYEERMEDKMMRGWGRSTTSTPGGVASAEDWLV